MMNSTTEPKQELFFEIGKEQINKFNEELCGDAILVNTANNVTTIILSDGLGSGVKANILATLTSKIISVMIEKECSIDEIMETLVSTLPTCKERDLAYSTFSVMILDKKGTVHLVEYDNPKTFFLHKDRLQKISYKIRQIGDKVIREAVLKIEDGDLLAFVSDGEIQAGLNGSCNRNWDWDNVANFIERISGKDLSSSEIAFNLINVANRLYGSIPADDTSAVVVRARIKQNAAVFIGAPQDKSKDSEMVKDFMQVEGRKIVCGGTAGNIVCRELNRPISVDISTMVNDIPPIGVIEGIDLCTEGIITLSNTLKYIIEQISYKKLELEKSGASMLTTELLHADEIIFFIGKAENAANQTKNIPFEMGHKQQITESLIKELEKSGKKIQVHFY